MEQCRITKEMRDADERRGVPAHVVRPRYFVWENVPGAFSSAEGEDFRAVLEEIVRIKDGSCHVPRPDSGRWESAGGIVLGNEFSLAWRVLDAQFWGVAQRRRRIFLVADFAGRSAPKILFDQDSLFGDTAPRRSPWQGVAPAATGGADDTGGADLTAEKEKKVYAFHINQREETIDLGGISGALMATTNMQMQTFVSERPVAFAANQRDEVRDLHDVAGALGAAPGMKQQTFVANCLTPWDTQQERIFVPEGTAPTLAGADGGGGRNPAGLLFAAGFCAGAASTAGGIGYQEEISPTLKAAESGTNMVPSILCLNDQGGKQMHCTEDMVGTLRAQEHGHQPLVMATQQGGAEIGEGVCPAITAAAGMSGNNQPVLFENHGIDSRYTGPHEVAPTMSARYGTGGNNVPLVSQEPDTYCIAANIIDREVKNGGNGFGYQPDIAYTLNTVDRHSVFSRQRSDIFAENEVVSTQSARQHKDATDLVCQPYQETVGTLTKSDHHGIGNQYVDDDKCVVESRNLIRRLTPLECERLQGFPDHWTDVSGASDSARYKALGNSVAIPCVDFVLRGISAALRVARESM
ncbi:MAG: DNA cytosine methyltransferase [Oscillospiraceae bacterium]|nr:DNA cytosine methyltransferase [Oscillospiraceae bacterium]